MLLDHTMSYNPPPNCATVMSFLPFLFFLLFGFSFLGLGFWEGLGRPWIWDILLIHYLQFTSNLIVEHYCIAITEHMTVVCNCGMVTNVIIFKQQI